MDVKEHYKNLRALSWSRLWDEEVPQFDAAPAKERQEKVSVIRAVGVVFAESGTAEDGEKVRAWLLKLLSDPNEKVRRYAMAAMPKVGAGAVEEGQLLAALRTTTQEREKKFVSRALGKIGGKAALDEGLVGEAQQQIKATLARKESPSAIRGNAILEDVSGVVIQLRGRRGLEGIVAEEVTQTKSDQFKVQEIHPGSVKIIPLRPFSIADIYTLRCFGTVGFVLGEAETMDGWAEAIASPLAQHLWRAFTEGSIRYRLNFAGKGHQRAAVARLAAMVYARRPEILNDGRSVTWTVDIFPTSVELRPNMTPDPRFSYRQKDVPASSHPPLAACLARLAGKMDGEIVWDPFCGAALELVERSLLGGVSCVYGSDRSDEAIRIAQENFLAAGLKSVPAKFNCGDFRDGMSAGSATLIITNPPLGMRVPVPNLRQLITELFDVAAKVLRPGGRLVLVNPLSNIAVPSRLKLQYRQKVDMGGFECRVEKYLFQRAT